MSTGGATSSLPPSGYSTFQGKKRDRALALPGWGRTAAISLVSAAVAWFAFGLGRPVPLLDWFDLAIHETGHLLAMPLPEVAMFAAGSIAQVLFPLTMAVYFGIRLRDPAAAGFCLVWAGASAWDVSVYAADAVSQSLPLVGGGQHDWGYLLGHFEALHHTDRIAATIATSGGLLAAVGFGVIALALPAAHPRRGSATVAAPRRITPGADPWLAASQLPFHHKEPAVRRRVPPSPAGAARSASMTGARRSR